MKASELAGEKEVWILANIGNLFKNCGLFSEGVKYLERPIELEPKDQFSHERLGEALKKREQELEKATEILNDQSISSIKSKSVDSENASPE